MENEEEINAKILKITMTIQDKYPELSKFLTEMPVSIPNKVHPQINLKNLNDYYLSLEVLLNKYVENQKFTNL
jgi:hypothetical protein